MRNIIDESDFLKQLEKRGVSPQRLDELLEAFHVIIASRPDLFPSVPGTKLHRIIVNPFPGLKRLNLWFTYDDKNVRFVAVDEVE